MPPDGVFRYRWRRSHRACDLCHCRKVRCDLVHASPPCTNCRLDGLECQVTPRSVKRKRRAQENGAASAHLPETLAAGSPRMNLDEIGKDITPNVVPDISLGATVNPMDLSCETLLDQLFHVDPSNQAGANSSGLLSTSFETEVSYTYYGFLCLRGSHKLDFDQRDFLEKKGCFQVPAPFILDMILRQYFTHVQPYLPLIDESSFWEAYSLKVDQGNISGAICLFVFNAMMAACSPYLTEDIIKRAGWSDNRTARNMFYHRAQLLFDFDTVNDPLSIAKGSVLLAEQCLSSNNHAGSLWLDIALHHARLIGAHKHDGELDRKAPDTLCKKRLWWCILIRDMVLSIGLRIPAKISRIHSNMDSPAIDDLEDDSRFPSSLDFSTQNKYALNQIFGLQCRLAIIISEITTLAYGPTAEIRAEEAPMAEFQQILVDIDRCKTDLDCWRNDAISVIAFKSTDNQSLPEVTAFGHVVFIHHYMARLALCQCEIFALRTNRYYIGSHSYVQKLVAVNEALEHSINSICGGIRDLAAGTTKHLPIGLLSFSALPIILSSLDTKLPQTEVQVATRRCREKYLHEALEMLLTRYDITDDITQYIRKIKSFVHNKDGVGLIQAQHRSRSHSISVTTWCEVFLFDPQIYLRLSKLVDYTLSHGHFPRDDEISALFSRLQISVPAETDIIYTEPALSLEDRLSSDGSDDVESYSAHQTVFSPTSFLPSLEKNNGRTDEASGDDVVIIGRELLPDIDGANYWYDDVVETLWNTLGIPDSFSAFVEG